MNEPTPLDAAPLGLIEATGGQAADFLRAQLTNDVLRIGPDNHSLTAWCDAKGRALMIARLLESDNGYLLLLPAGLIEPLLKRLRMFVLRAQVELRDASADYRLAGLRQRGLPPSNALEHRDGQRVLGLPSDDTRVGRAVLLAPAHADLPAEAVALASADWELGEIDAGMPTIVTATQGLFVPQMLNLHWLLGIDFDKGCYPGQEVIARLHYRGRLTQRIYRLAFEGARPAPGVPVTDSAGARCGTVIRSASTHDERGRLLAVLKTAARDERLQTENARLAPLDLPYAIPA